MHLLTYTYVCRSLVCFQSFVCHPFLLLYLNFPSIIIIIGIITCVDTIERPFSLFYLQYLHAFTLPPLLLLFSPQVHASRFVLQSKSCSLSPLPPPLPYTVGMLHIQYCTYREETCCNLQHKQEAGMASKQALVALKAAALI